MEEPTIPWMMFCGGIGGMCGWVGGFLCDNIKTRIQTDDFKNPKYKSLWNIPKQLGPKDVVRGFTPGFVRAFPVNAVTFIVFEISVKLIYQEPF